MRKLHITPKTKKNLFRFFNKLLRENGISNKLQQRKMRNKAAQVIALSMVLKLLILKFEEAVLGFDLYFLLSNIFPFFL